MSDWTADRKLEASNMWLMGFSAQYIAAHLGGVTRNAVLGLLYRLNVKAPRVRRATQTESRAKNGRNSGIVQRVRQLVEDDRKIDPDGLVDLPADQSPHACDFWALSANQCRWPLSGQGIEILYCGAAAKGSWCTRHHQIAFAKRSSRPA